MTLYEDYPTTIYDPENVHSNEELNPLISDTSKFVIKIWEKILSKHKGLIIQHPYSKLPFFALLAYYSAEVTGKDVVIITRSVRETLIKYQLLGKGDGRYIHKFCIPIVVEDNIAEVKIVSPMVKSNKIKHSESTYLMEVAELPDIRKVLICDYNYLSEALSTERKTQFSDLGKELSIKMNIGTVLFEEFDRALKSNDVLDSFIKWVKENIQNIHIVAHSSNCYTEKVNKKFIESGLDIINLNHYLMREIISKTKKESTQYDLLPKSISSINVQIKKSISLPNIDYITLEIFPILKKLRNMKLPYTYRALLALPNLLRSLIIHPTQFKTRMMDVEGNYLYGNVDDYLNLLKEYFSLLDEEQKETLTSFARKTMTLYKEFKETERYGDSHSYKTQCKNSALLHYLEELNNDNKVNNVCVVCFLRFEKRVLVEQLNKAKFHNLVIDVKTFGEIKSAEEDEDFLIMPGVPYSNADLIKIINQHKEVYFLTYEGWEQDKLKTRLDAIQGFGNKFKMESLASLIENSKKEDIELPKNIEEIKKSLPSIKQDIVDEGEDEFEHIIEDPLQFELNINASIAQKAVDKGDCVSKNNVLHVTDVINKFKLKIQCGNRSKFCVLNDDKGSYGTISFDLLKEGQIIVQFGENEDIIDILADLFGIRDKVDTEIIKLWEEIFSDGVSKLFSELSDNRERGDLLNVYGTYVDKCKEFNSQPKTYQSFRLWITGGLIVGPDDKDDVLVLGKLTGFPNIEKEYDFIHNQMQIVKVMHMQIGRQISNIISKLLRKQSLGKLSYQESYLADKIHLFHIDNIEKNNL